MRPFTPQRAFQPPPTFDAGYATPEGMRQAPDMRIRRGQNKLDKMTGQGGYGPYNAPGSDKDPMHAQGGPYQKLLPGQTLGGGGSGSGANPVGGATIAPGNAMVNGQLKFVGSPDYGGTRGPNAQGKHIGGQPRRYGNADDYYADHSNLRDFHAENSVDPVTGMKVKPSSFDMESKRAELARNGEWDALARLNNYTRAQASGDPQAIGSAREDITNFRAIRQAKQQYGEGGANPYAPDTRAPGDFGQSEYAPDTRAPGDFSPVRPATPQIANPRFDTGNINGLPDKDFGSINRVSSPQGRGYSILRRR